MNRSLHRVKQAEGSLAAAAGAQQERHEALRKKHGLSDKAFAEIHKELCEPENFPVWVGDTEYIVLPTPGPRDKLLHVARACVLECIKEEYQILNELLAENLEEKRRKKIARGSRNVR